MTKKVTLKVEIALRFFIELGVALALMIAKLITGWEVSWWVVFLPAYFEWVLYFIKEAIICILIPIGSLIGNVMFKREAKIINHLYSNEEDN